MSSQNLYTLLPYQAGPRPPKTCCCLCLRSHPHSLTATPSSFGRTSPPPCPNCTFCFGYVHRHHTSSLPLRDPLLTASTRSYLKLHQQDFMSAQRQYRRVRTRDVHPEYPGCLWRPHEGFCVLFIWRCQISLPQRQESSDTTTSVSGIARYICKCVRTGQKSFVKWFPYSDRSGPLHHHESWHNLH